MKLQLPAVHFAPISSIATALSPIPCLCTIIAWKKTLKEWSCDLDEELFYSWGGRPVMEIISALNRKNGLKHARRSCRPNGKKASTTSSCRSSRPSRKCWSTSKPNTGAFLSQLSPAAGEVRSSAR